jgi:DNA replication protein DnaC
MSILDRAGLGHLAARLPSPLSGLPPAEPDRFDLVSFRREQAARYLSGHYCAVRFGAASVDDSPEAARWVRQLLADDPAAAPMLLLIGPTGSGKSHLAWGVVRALKLGRAEQGRGLVCRVVDHADLNAQTRPRPDDGHVGALDRCIDAELLVLDDLAATRATEWTEETLYRLVEARHRVKAPTVVTTNHPIRRPAGDRLASRLLDAVVVALTGPDRRLAEARTRQAGGAR